MFNNLVKYSIKENKAGTGSSCTGISLQRLLTGLVNNLPGVIALNNVIIKNEIPSELKVLADQNQVARLIDELLTTVATNARNTSIFITAERFIDTVTLTLEDRNNYNGYALSFSLMSLEQQARFIGGDITIKGAQKKVTTVSLSFPDAKISYQPTIKMGGHENWFQSMYTAQRRAPRNS